MPGTMSLLTRACCSFWALITFTTAGSAAEPVTPVASRPAALPALQEMLASPTDVWGEAAMRQPNGASYEFFAPLLAPPRYVNADFRYYPIVLAAPNGSVKARLISNGSGMNLRGGTRSWHNIGVPLVFRVGPDLFRFGELANRVSEPELVRGYLPIVEIRYQHPHPYRTEGQVPLDQPQNDREPEVYRLEAFAATDPTLSASGVTLVRFSLAGGSEGIITVVGDKGEGINFEGGRLLDPAGKVIAVCDDKWKNAPNGTEAVLTGKESATLAIATLPLAPEAAPTMKSDTWERHRQAAISTWEDQLSKAMNVETPETRVNAAWKNLLIQNLSLINKDRMFYSAGNQYEKLYEAEGSEAVMAMMAWGYEDHTRRTLIPLLEFTRKGLEYHIAGFKLNNICRFYWQTRDTEFVRTLRPYWDKELRRILDNRSADNGLLPKEQFCGDISTPVYSINVNSRAWRALVDMAALLDELGESSEATRLREAAAGFRAHIIDALQKSIHRETSPPFVPLALFSEEPVHSPITATRIGGYWNIVIGYTISAHLFPAGSPEESWIARYQETNGGVAMGMIRSGGSAHAFWTGAERVNPLYGLRYTIDTLRRDDPERALVSFYGMMAQGHTRNTLVGAEGSTLMPVDERGRFFYCPPNSASNAFLLTVLRNLLVQDWDLNDDGRPDTLRLMFATPRRWLADGKSIRVEQAPTSFGPVSILMTSHLGQGFVEARVELPARQAPEHVKLRARVPDGWKVTGAMCDGAPVQLEKTDTVKLTGRQGVVSIRFATQKD